jgi:hypothetical protein
MSALLCHLTKLNSHSELDGLVCALSADGVGRARELTGGDEQAPTRPLGADHPLRACDIHCRFIRNEPQGYAI